MSRLSGLARTLDKKDGQTGLESSSASTSVPAPSSSEGPSLSALSSEVRPRQRLSGLGRVTAGDSTAALSSLTSRKESGEGSGSSSSLQNLARISSSTGDGAKAGLTRSAGGLTRLAAGVSSPSITSGGTNSISADGGTSSRTSLTLLARSRNTPIPVSRPTASATGRPVPPSSDTPSSNAGPSPSLTELASASRSPSLRRSLTSLAGPAQPSNSTAPSPSSLQTSIGQNQPSVGLTARAGGEGGGLSRLVAGGGSSSLSSLAAAATQKRTAPSLTGLSNSQVAKDDATVTPASNSTSTYTQPSSGATSEADRETRQPITETTTTAASNSHTLDIQNNEDDTANGESDPLTMTTTTATFSSLIAPPSHFAVSIFERLDPVPSPIALATNTILQSDPALLRTILTSSMTTASGAVTPSRVFQFDVPSPDDVVFRAQGQRPATTRT
ncbi:hypothetical protein BGZ54_000775 [Gamsiella multidivaricata]|nr:hypothetical protein BGZ54_000775 [Gamsiella multidivaricata]